MQYAEDDDVIELPRLSLPRRFDRTSSSQQQRHSQQQQQQQPTTCTSNCTAVAEQDDDVDDDSYWDDSPPTVRNVPCLSRVGDGTYDHDHHHIDTDEVSMAAADRDDCEDVSNHDETTTTTTDTDENRNKFIFWLDDAAKRIVDQSRTQTAIHLSVSTPSGAVSVLSAPACEWVALMEQWLLWRRHNNNYNNHGNGAAASEHESILLSPVWMNYYHIWRNTIMSAPTPPSRATSTHCRAASCSPTTSRNATTPTPSVTAPPLLIAWRGNDHVNTLPSSERVRARQEATSAAPGHYNGGGGWRDEDEGMCKRARWEGGVAWQNSSNPRPTQPTLADLSCDGEFEQPSSKLHVSDAFYRRVRRDPCNFTQGSGGVGGGSGVRFSPLSGGSMLRRSNSPLIERFKGRAASALPRSPLRTFASCETSDNVSFEDAASEGMYAAASTMSTKRRREVV